jgi:hypothetical protein
MKHRLTALATALALCALQPAQALQPRMSKANRSEEEQSQPKAQHEVRTFMLRHLDPEAAAALVTPYVDLIPGAGVFRAGGSIRGITVRAPFTAMARVDGLLKEHDRAPTTVRLRFQVVSALDSAVSDPELSSIESELRSVLKFRGYRLLAQGFISSNDDSPASATLTDGKTDPFQIQTFTYRIDPSDRGSVSLNVALQGAPFTAGPNRTGTKIIETRITMPFGQSVVVGSGSAVVWPEPNRPRNQAILLVVRADQVTSKP